MKTFNQNLSNMETYQVSVVPDGIKRLHANECNNPILGSKILMQNIDENLNFYPEQLVSDLINGTSAFYGVVTDKVIPTNGSDEAIDLCIRTFCSPGDTILVPKPTFSMYEQYATAFGINVEKIDLIERDAGFFLDENALIETAQKSNVKIVFIPNPLANVGKLIDKEVLLKIVKSLHDTVIVIDEAYIEFCSLENSLINQIDEYKNLVILRTCSKFFGLAGIRLGFMFTNFADDVRKIKPPYNVNTLTCKIGINLFHNIKPDIIKQRQAEIFKKKNDIATFLKNFEEVEKIFDSDTNFFFVKLTCKADEFAEKMLNDFKIKIRPFSGKFENYCRISVL